MKTYFKNSEIPIEKMTEGISRQIMGYDTNLMVVKVFFEKGAIAGLHKHPHQQIGYIEKGKFEFEIGDKKMILEKGDSFIASSNIMHGAKCLEQGIIIDTFSPKRDDFLQ